MVARVVLTGGQGGNAHASRKAPWKKELSAVMSWNADNSRYLG